MCNIIWCDDISIPNWDNNLVQIKFEVDEKKTDTTERITFVSNKKWNIHFWLVLWLDSMEHHIYTYIGLAYKYYIAGGYEPLFSFALLLFSLSLSLFALYVTIFANITRKKISIFAQLIRVSKLSSCYLIPNFIPIRERKHWTDQMKISIFILFFDFMWFDSEYFFSIFFFAFITFWLLRYYKI